MAHDKISAAVEQEMRGVKPSLGDHYKIAQDAVLYLPPEKVGSGGVRCADCMMFVKRTSECTVVDPPSVSGEKGACGLYLKGQGPERASLHKAISKSTAGYRADGPFRCGNCKNFNPEYAGQEGACDVVRGYPLGIVAGGCCNAWEPRLQQGMTIAVVISHNGR